MQLSQKDLDLLSWINKMRFVTLSQISKKFSVSVKTASWRTRRLIKEGYLKKRKIFFNGEGIYFVTSKGIPGYDGLYAIKNISIASCNHSLKVVDISIELEKNGYCWMSDREYIKLKGTHRKYSKDFHAPDGILIKDGKWIAVEVELSLKSHKRMEEIMRYYRRSNEFSGVWYFVPNKRIYDKINEYAVRDENVKVYYLK